MRTVFLIFVASSIVGCSTLDQSMRLGAFAGALTGVAAIHAGHNAVGSTPSSQEVSLNAGLGLGVGLLASYLIHQKVTEERQSSFKEVEIHFGDLPPSPFIMPSPNFKKRGP